MTSAKARRLDTYAQRAKEAWGQTQAYREFEEKSKDRVPETEAVLAKGLMSIFAEMGRLSKPHQTGNLPSA